MFKSKPFPHRPDRTQRRNTRRGGQAVIESVFTWLPTFALIFAFVDFGLALFRWSTLQNAVREGVRYAVTFQTQTGFGQDRSVKNIVEAYSMGMVTATQTPAKIFVNYYSPTNTTTAIVAPGGNVPGNIVEVSVQGMSWAWVAPISGTLPGIGSGSPSRDTTPLAISVYSSDILGGFPPGIVSVTR